MTYEAISVKNPELSLIESAKQGDDTAFSRLMETHMDRVYAVALRIVKDPAEAEDVTQEVFINVYRKIGSFKGDSAFSTWIYRVTVNRALRHVKKLGRWVSVDDPAKMEQQEDKRPSPEDNAVERQKQDQLRRAIDELPDKQRTVLTLRVEQSLPFKEIARILGRSVGGVKANYFHAVRKVQAAFSGGN